MRLRSARPLTKVQASGASGAIAILFLWVLETYAGVDMPEYVAAAITTIIMSIVAYVTPLLPGEIAVLPTEPRVIGGTGKIVAPSPE